MLNKKEKELRLKKYFINNKPLLFTVAVIAIYIIFLIWVTTRNYAGNVDWLPVGSTFFGIPDEISEKFDVELLIQNDASGWDGQFYYYISNDLLGTKGYSEHVDSPPYRWQRIGLPLAAKLVSLIHLENMVSVYDYLIANLIILGLGVFVFAKYLYEKRANLLYILPWCFSAGVLITLKSLLPDSAADAFAIIATIMLLKRKYVAYAIAMAWACLTREGYVAIAFFVFLWGVMGWLEKDKRYNFKFAALLAIPGIVFVLWYLYVTLQFGALPFTQAHGITKLFLTEWPIVFIDAIQKANVPEFVGLIFYLTTIILSACLAYILGKKEKRYWTFLAYIFIVGSFGFTVMKHWSGYLKGISYLFALIPVMVIELDIWKSSKNSEVKDVVKFFVNTYCIWGLAITVFTTPLHASNMAQNYLFRTPAMDPVEYSNQNPLTEFSGMIEIKKIEKNPYVSNKVLELFSPETAMVTLNVFNGTNQLWSKNQTKAGKYAINMGYKWFQKDDLSRPVLEGRTALINDISPGTEEEEKLFLRYPSKKGQYLLKISMVQEGVAWFCDAGGAQTQLFINID